MYQERWMLVREDMTWDEVRPEEKGGVFHIHIYKKKKDLECSLAAKNETTKVYRLKDMITDEIYDLVDFAEMDRMFEENKIIFRNRRGLHKEVRRYIDFSLT
ncbi:hypothetical protein [Geovibrio ferrireducens]|uniref:hypothetical protein n=1 Tax=Geovibrio ferrireducens TaxID=46201 RepID=UPI002246CA29|nr:hypothetical protein [Geovibrio ferrireducens]